jgi:hypothetical protein
MEELAPTEEVAEEQEGMQVLPLAEPVAREIVVARRVVLVGLRRAAAAELEGQAIREETTQVQYRER